MRASVVSYVRRHEEIGRSVRSSPTITWNMAFISAGRPGQDVDVLDHEARGAAERVLDRTRTRR